MRLKRHGEYGFNTEHISSFLESKINYLATLQRRLPGSVLVALDTEGITQHFDGRVIHNDGISEIGVAVFCANEKAPEFIPHLNQFYDQNDIEAFTIRVREREHGPAIGTMTEVGDEEAGPRLQKFLSRFEGRRIFIGFSILAELKWIAEEFPALATLFTEWVDVQELVSQRYRNLASCDRTRPDQLGLYDTLKAMKVSGWRSHHQLHRAANDAVKTLAVVSGLLCNTPFQVQEREVGVSVYTSLPPLQTKKIGTKYHGFTARISAASGDKLPLQTPVGLAKHCGKYLGLIGVGLNSRNEIVAIGRVRYWWVSFRDQQSLTDFIACVDCSILEGIQLRVLADGKTNRGRGQLQPTLSPRAYLQ